MPLGGEYYGCQYSTGFVYRLRIDEAGRLESAVSLRRYRSSDDDAAHIAGIRRVWVLDCERPTDSDCIVVDMHMPGMSGLAVQQAVLNDGLKVPVIIMTGRDDGAVTVAQSLGAVGFFRKPFDDQALIDAIESAVRGRDRR